MKSLWKNLSDKTKWIIEVSHLAQSLCHKCLDELGECPIAYSGATCQEIIKAAKGILEIRRKNLADRKDEKERG